MTQLSPCQASPPPPGLLLQPGESQDSTSGPCLGLEGSGKALALLVAILLTWASWDQPCFLMCILLSVLCGFLQKSLPLPLRSASHSGKALQTSGSEAERTRGRDTPSGATIPGNHGVTFRTDLLLVPEVKQQNPRWEFWPVPGLPLGPQLAGHGPAERPCPQRDCTGLQLGHLAGKVPIRGWGPAIFPPGEGLFAGVYMEATPNPALGISSPQPNWPA